MTLQTEGVHESQVTGLERIAQGKVREIYAVDEHYLLMVASDRLSAFDVVLDDPIPGKGAVLTSLSLFWMNGEGRHISNHLTDINVADVVKDPDEAAALRGRALVVKRLRPLPVEAIVRGYVIGSGWKDYLRDGAISGVTLPEGLEQAAKLPAPIFTPSSKAEVGTHDENITYDTMCDLVGGDVANQVRELSVDLYSRAAAYALERGIIIADTKFEFGLDDSGKVVLIDEVLTPDSSRFWPLDEYRVGISPPSFDKQYVRDYLETLDWDKTAPAPRLPSDVLAETAAKYQEAQRRLMQG